MSVYPCTTCGVPAYRDLGTESFCATHYAELIATFDAANLPSQGRGMPGRTTDPEDLTCTACGATWHGPIGELCNWCARWIELANQWQIDNALTAPAVDVDDANYDQQMNAWAKRLRTMVDDGIVNELRARNAVAAAAKRRDADIAHREAPRVGKRAS